MPSILSHPAVPLAFLRGGLKGSTSKRLVVLCVFLTMMPDADVIAFKFGIPYESQWGHRGFTHSLGFATFIGILSAVFAPRLMVDRVTAFFWTFASVLSHAVLDAMTTGGLGVAFFWPVSEARYFLPYRPIQVSPIGVSQFFSLWGVKVVLSELLWIWTPCVVLSAVVRHFKRRRSASQSLAVKGASSPES